MDRAIQQFEVNLNSAKQLGIIHSAFENQFTEAISLDELLKAKLVLAVSALDCYIHDLVRIGMTKMFQSEKGESPAFLNFGVSLNFVKDLLGCQSESEKIALFDQEIRRLLGFKTFQSADNISQALSFIGITLIWNKVARAIKMTATDIRTELNVIVDRRNRIVHEGDIDPSLGLGMKYPIDAVTVRRAVSFIDTIVQSIQKIATSESKNSTKLNIGAK